MPLCVIPVLHWIAVVKAIEVLAIGEEGRDMIVAGSDHFIVCHSTNSATK